MTSKSGGGDCVGELEAIEEFLILDAFMDFLIVVVFVSCSQ